MQITIGEYTTRNGCVATVLARDGLLFRGVVIIQGGLTQIGLWWDREGCVYFPEGSWSNESDYGMVFKTDKPYVNLLYSNETYAMLASTPSPFDITEPKQKPTMKSPLKPGKYKTLIGNEAYVLQLPDGVYFKDRYGSDGLAVLFKDLGGNWIVEGRMLDGRYSTHGVSNHDLVESVALDENQEQCVSEPPQPVLVQKQRLIKFPNGSWLDPKIVTSINIFNPGLPDENGVRYVTVYTTINDISIKCASLEQAQNLADDLAEKVNSIA